MEQTSTTPRPGILLVGPTGSGKTPLGALLEERGLAATECRHFDFGAWLRRIAFGEFRSPRITDEDLATLAASLCAGTLLENEHFHIARDIFLDFVAGTGPETRIVMNGLPRHLGQARDVAMLVEMRLAIHLRCTPDVVAARIESDTGGDRAVRTDDSDEEVARKLRLFEDRTAPLLDHYRVQGVEIAEIDVTAAVTPAEMWQLLQEKAK